MKGRVRDQGNSSRREDAGRGKRAMICLVVAGILVMLVGFCVGAAAVTFLPDVPPPG
jgi:hypothetical protein